MLNCLKQIMCTVMIKWEVAIFWSLFLRKGEGKGIIKAWLKEAENVCWLLNNQSSNSLIFLIINFFSQGFPTY